MFAKAVLNDEERTVDPQLGFPRGYAKLCRHAHIQAQGLISPFTQGPPQRFHPYAAHEEEIAKLKVYDDLFPILEERNRDATNPKNFVASLWQQLDHMGNAGFDPAIFRVDTYGNVLYWDADLGSPLAWEVDHWFPQARGGKTVPGNLRLVQWQACQRKGKKLEFLVPWWDLQLGVSVNQFLSVFASKNASFRHRAFSFFFLSGENEQLSNCKVVQGHSWPRQFKDRKNQVGLAAAALQNASEGVLQAVNTIHRLAKHDYSVTSFVGNCNNAVKRDLQILGIDHFKDNISKHTRTGECTLDKENEGSVTGKYFTNSLVPLQREQQWRRLIEDDKKQKLEESAQLEEELQVMKVLNVKEKAVLEQLEQNLAKQKKRVEKQRRWSETQSQYRLCLEKMIRDTLHQCVVYKEQARLNQAACNALLARLESQKVACDAAEEQLVRKVKQREDLDASARPQIRKRVRHQGHTDVGSGLKPRELLLNINTSCDPREEIASDEKGSNDVRSKQYFHSGTCHQQHGTETNEASLPKDIALDKKQLRTSHPTLLVRHKHATRVNANHEKEACKKEASVQKCIEEHAQDIDAHSKIFAAQGNLGAKKRALEASDELEVVLLGYEYQANEDENANREESVGDNGTTQNSIMKNNSVDDEDDAANESAHIWDEAYDESNNGDHEFEAVNHKDEGYGQSRNADDKVHCGTQGPGELATGVTQHLLLQACVGRESEEGFQEPRKIEKTKDDEQLDELLREVLAMQDRVNEAMVDAIREEQDEERVKRVGKLNLDKWLQQLLLDSGYGQGQEHTSLISLPLDTNNGLGCQKQLNGLASERNRGLTKKAKSANLDNETEIEGLKSLCKTNSELNDGSMIGGLLKKLSFKNGDAPLSNEIEKAKQVESVKGASNLNEIKKPVDRRISPWRWVSPASKRSTSTGSETRARRLSPWRRSSKEDKVDERKMMEDFSKLKVGGERKHGGEGIASEVLDTSGQEKERSTSAKLKSSSLALPLTGVQERSSSTPPVKAHRNSRMALALSPIPRGHDVVSSKHMVPMPVQQCKDDGGGDEIANLGAKGGAARKAHMLKKSASARGGRGGNADMSSAPALAGRAGGVPLKEVGRGGGSVLSEEGNEEHKASLFEDLDPQDGLRASISLAWKKAVKKFELGRPPL